MAWMAHRSYRHMSIAAPIDGGLPVRISGEFVQEPADRGTSPDHDSCLNSIRSTHLRLVVDECVNRPVMTCSKTCFRTIFVFYQSEYTTPLDHFFGSRWIVVTHNKFYQLECACVWTTKFMPHICVSHTVVNVRVYGIWSCVHGTYMCIDHYTQNKMCTTYGICVELIEEMRRKEEEYKTRQL